MRDTVKAKKSFASAREIGLGYRWSIRKGSISRTVINQYNVLNMEHDQIFNIESMARYT